MAKKNKGKKQISKHKESGKHSLQYDTIFKGKKEELTEENDTSYIGVNENFTYETGTLYHHETINNERYTRELELKKQVYEVLEEHTELSFHNNRRKPSKDDFNNYYFLLKTHLDDDKFTNVELFNELAYYFSDNLFNMFKLLDNKWRKLIITELQDHVGKIENKTEITPKNLSIGAEIEFETEDPITGDPMFITGVIEEKDSEKDEYRINSYENIYIISIADVTKILNNIKFKYNLNKLNNLDFL